MNNNKFKIDVVIISGKALYVVGTLAVIGAGTVAKEVSKGLHKIKNVVKDKRTNKKDEEESE